MSVQLGDPAPDFTQESTAGTIKFHEWLGKSWGVLFSHPKDFTPVCTTELGRTAKLGDEFKKRDVKVLAVSVDTVADQARLRSVTLEREFVRGTPRSALAAQAEHADLVVVGARGHGAVGAALLGSVSTWLLHHLHRPIAVVPLTS